MPIFGWWVVLGLVVIATGWVGLTAFRYGLLPTLVRGAPYVPTHPDLVKTMIELAELKSSDRVIDFGSGDGRIVIAAAQAGVRESIGYEIDPGQVWRSRIQAQKLHLNNAVFYAKSFWEVPLAEMDVVFLYGLPPYMQRLSNKFRAELKPGARIISSIYELPDWKAECIRDGIRVYRVV